MNASGAKNPPRGSRKGRSASGSRLRKTPSESGAPAYISTDALVIRPTSDCQLGNGRKQMQPVTNADDERRPTARRGCSVHSKIVGT